MLERFLAWFRQKKAEREFEVTGGITSSAERAEEASSVQLIQAKLKELAK